MPVSLWIAKIDFSILQRFIFYDFAVSNRSSFIIPCSDTLFPSNSKFLLFFLFDISKNFFCVHLSLSFVQSKYNTQYCVFLIFYTIFYINCVIYNYYK